MGKKNSRRNRVKNRKLSLRIVRCPTCVGWGYEIEKLPTKIGIKVERRICSTCDGLGYLDWSKCVKKGIDFARVIER